jgi:hypothetical protein
MPGGPLGGLFADSAVAGSVDYANGNNWAFVITGGPPLGGSITALAGDGSGELWQFESESPNISGVAVANGVVYFQSTLSGDLYALDANSGAQLAQVNISTCDGSIPTGGQTAAHRFRAAESTWAWSIFCRACSTRFSLREPALLLRWASPIRMARQQGY